MKYEVKFATGPRTEISLSMMGKDVEEMQQLLDAAVRNFKAGMCVDEEKKDKPVDAHGGRTYGTDYGYPKMTEEPTDARTKDLVVAGNSCTCIRTDKPCVFPYPLADCRRCRVKEDTPSVNLSHHVCMGCVSRNDCPHRAEYQEMVAKATARINIDTVYGTQVAPYEIHIRCKHFKLPAPKPTDCTYKDVFWDPKTDKYNCAIHTPNLECRYREYIDGQQFCTIAWKLKEEAGE